MSSIIIRVIVVLTMTTLILSQINRIAGSDEPGFSTGISCYGFPATDTIMVCGGSERGKCVDSDKCVCYSGYFGNKCEFSLQKNGEKVAAGEDHSCLIRRNGKIYCFGDNAYVISTFFFF